MSTQSASVAVQARSTSSPESPPPRRDGEITRALGYAPGRRLRVPIRYSLWGPAGAPVRVALGGISADRRCDRWWAGLFGPGCALDPERYRVLGIDWLDAFWPDGGAVTTGQQAGALALVLEHLDIPAVHTVLGASYGAMTALAFGARFPRRAGRVVAISGAHAAQPMAVARRLIQRRLLELAVGGGYAADGLEVARALALTTYRPASLFAERFADDDPQTVLDSLQHYFRRQGEHFRARFGVQRFLCLSESLDRHRVDPAAIGCPVDLIAVTSDTLVPPAQMRALAKALGRRCRYREIHSAYGHDAFLKEHRQLNRLLAEAPAGERP